MVALVLREELEERILVLTAIVFPKPFQRVIQGQQCPQDLLFTFMFLREE